MPSENIFLLPGEMAFSRDPIMISTLLGSCVAVSLHDRQQRWGGINHYMVPEAMGNLPEGKVGRTAISSLIRMATMAGSKVSDLDARIMGGATVLGSRVAGSVSALGDIGAKNSELARAMQTQLRIPIIEEAVGGFHGRRIRLDSANGQVFIDVMGGSSAVEKIRPPRRDGERIRVLIIDDSALVRQLLRKVIATSTDFEVCGEAEDPFAAREAILDLD